MIVCWPPTPFSGARRSTPGRRRSSSRSYWTRQFALGDYQSTTWAAALAGRPVGAVVAYADPDPATNGFYHCYHIVRVVAIASGGRFVGCAHGAASNRGEIKQHPTALADAATLGRKLYEAAMEPRQAR